MNNIAPTIHEAFNARAKSTKDVCRSFIVNDYFVRLAGLSHSIMIGPRGSGKTTLMKMLQVNALEEWEHEQAEGYRKQVKYSGVFIPTDRFWKTQYEKIESKAGEFKDVKECLGSVFIYHVLERLCAVTLARVDRSQKRKNNFRTVNLTKVDEVDLVKELSGLWEVIPSTNTLRSLEISISKKKAHISSYIHSRVTGIQDNISEENTLTGELVKILEPSLRIINSFFDEVEEKWAFLFDELELAPDHVVQPLIDSMRGGPEELIIKLSLSPFHKNVRISESVDSSMHKQDLSFINLTGARERDGIEFSKNLCSQVLKNANLIGEIDTYFEKPLKIDVENEFLELSKKDPEFLSYLEKQNIDLNKFSDYGEGNKLPTIRKIQFIAHLRNYYLKENGIKISRNRPSDYYSGIDNLFKAMEYNPRMLIGLMNNMISLIREKGVVKIPSQLDHLSKNLSSYNSLLNTISVSTSIDKIRTISDLMDILGKYIQYNTIGKKFNSQPKGSLTFLKVNEESLIEGIGLALNAGALIVDNSEDNISSDIVDIKNSRIRLSHMFSHKYKFTMTKLDKVDLMDVFCFDSLTEREKQNNSGIELNQEGLF